MNENRAEPSPRINLTRISPLATKNTSEATRERRVRLRNESKLLQPQKKELIKVNQSYGQPVVIASKPNLPKLPKEQRLHVIPDEDNIMNIPNLEEQTPQQQPHLVDPEINAVIDPTTRDMLEHRHLMKVPEHDV